VRTGGSGDGGIVGLHDDGIQVTPNEAPKVTSKNRETEVVLSIKG
jgi:hypothetical protein